jgi:hypothetical protein
MRQDIIESAKSYSVGGLSLAIANLTDIANAAQAVTVILACLVVAIRLTYDAVKLWRYLRAK